MMRPCNRCLENAWDYVYLDDGFVRATCKLCAYEVEWKTKTRRVLTEADNPDNKAPQFLWTMEGERMLRNGIPMTISKNKKGIGYVRVRNNKAVATQRNIAPLKSYLKDY